MTMRAVGEVREGEDASNRQQITSKSRVGRSARLTAGYHLSRTVVETSNESVFGHLGSHGLERRKIFGELLHWTT